MKTNNKGFTLVEQMIVVTIIAGTIAMVVMPMSRGFLRNSRINSAKAQMETFRTGLRNFRLDIGHYPMDSWRASPPDNAYLGNGLGDTTMVDWKVLTALNASEVPLWKGPYVLDVPNDPWGHRYLFMDYSYAGSSVTAIVCQGPQGNNGGAANYILGFANTYLPGTKNTYPPDRNNFSIVRNPGNMDDFNIILWMK